MTVSLPPAMIETVEKVRKVEHRTRSELIREALRTYFSLRRTYTPIPSELRAIEKGRTAIRRGEYFTLDKFRTYLGASDQKARAKKHPARPPK